MRRQLFPAIRMMAVLTLVLGVAYPMLLLGVSQGLFKDKANGSRVTDRNGVVVGSALLGQGFSGDKYFQTRPSAAGVTAAGTPNTDGKPGDVTDLTLSNSGGSNLGPTNPTLIEATSKRVADYRRANGLAEGSAVPVDAVTSSASGVDPHISVANARLQVARVAVARGMRADDVNATVDAHVTEASLGFLGEKAVNVLELNLDLDRRG